MDRAEEWLTLHESLEAGLTYAQIGAAVDELAVASRRSGSATLYRASDVEAVVAQRQVRQSA